MTDESAPATAPPKPSRKVGRRIGTVVAVVLAVTLFLVATAAVWAKNTVLSTDRIVAAVDRAAEDPAVIDALSLRITDEIMSVLDPSGFVEGVLPDQLAGLAPLIEGALTNIVREQVEGIVGSEQGRALLEAAVRVAHARVIDLLEGGGLSPDSFFSVTDGEVVLDVVPLLVATIDALQDRGVIPDSFDLTQIVQETRSDRRVQLLAATFGVSIPDDFGQITVLDAARVEKASSTLAAAQRALAVFQKATVLLVVLALAMIAVALGVSVNRRRTLAQIALGIGIGALIMRIAIDRVVAALDRAIDKAGAKAAAVNITESLTESLARTLVTLAIVGLVVGVIAFLLKPPKDGGESWLTSMLATHADAARWVIGGVSLALLWVVGMSWVAVLIIGALCVAGVLYVNRVARPAAESPAA